jgi:hypothetical protein
MAIANRDCVEVCAFGAVRQKMFATAAAQRCGESCWPLRMQPAGEGVSLDAVIGREADGCGGELALGLMPGLSWIDGRREERAGECEPPSGRACRAAKSW